MIGIDLLRHGDTGRRSYRGQLDDPLTPLGWSQLRAAVRGCAWDAIASSSLQRCAAFATELAAQRGIALHLDARLAEYHFGAWQGVPIETLNAVEGKALARFWADPVAHPPPGAETFEAFRARVCAAMDAVARSGARRPLVITHGGVIRLLRCIAEGCDFGEMANIEVPHAALYRLHWPFARTFAIA